MPDGQAPVGNAAHNVADLEAAIQNAAKRQLEIEQKIVEQHDKHLQPLKDEKKKIRKAFQKLTGMKLKDFDTNYRRYKRRDEARRLLDEDEGPQILDNDQVIAGAFAKLDPGMQVDWVKAVEGDVGGESAADPSAEFVDYYAFFLQCSESQPAGHEEDIVIVTGADVYHTFGVAAVELAKLADMETQTWVDGSPSGVMWLEIPAGKFKLTTEHGQTMYNITIVDEDGERSRIEKQKPN